MTKKIKTSPKGRVCAYPNCKQILSIYNHKPYCHIHLRKKVAQKDLAKIPYHHRA